MSKRNMKGLFIYSMRLMSFERKLYSYELLVIIIALITELFDLKDLRSTVQRPCLTCGEVRAAARTGYAPAPPTCSSTRRPTSPTVSIPPPNFRCPPFQYLPLYLNFIKPKAMVLILDGIPEIILFYYIC